MTAHLNVLAIEDSWTAAFVGTSPLKGLKEHVVEQLNLGKSKATKPAYGRYCSIVQSSGMGKSRLLDELSKEFFLIPINLRPSNGRGLSFHLYFRGPPNLSYRLSTR